MNILIIAATKQEISLFQIEKSEEIHIYKSHNVEILISGPGILATAFHLTRKLKEKQYDLIINAGIAGSLDENIIPGDVVQVKSEQIADSGVEDHDNFLDLFNLGLIDNNEFPFKEKWLSPKTITTPSIEKIKKVNAITVNKAHGNENSIRQLKKRTTGQIESLEGAACFYVCMMLKTNVIQLRAISNMVEPRNRSNWKIELAITNLNATLNLLLDELLSSE
ncbi:MAG TPA: futalosine hydrolase [Bacteroidia bacterium]|nr:futalosine hydrolase [Bacteroidia bacterium]MBP7714756.1 futalosine hydrolase [Bacteroidia bacterium]MBP8669297.1 futalosine hydrolase [Bacteroidia bacterium]HQW16585.1 futalosine hydrolase [Bacteroidia bacterium]HQW47987.1 futalosine hydrolase [Bacteroidia bacterium]